MYCCVYYLLSTVIYCDNTVVLRILSGTRMIKVSSYSLRVVLKHQRAGCGVWYRSAEGAKELAVANQVGRLGGILKNTFLK